MSREILARASELVEKGLPDEGIHLLRDLLSKEEFRDEAIPLLAVCYETKTDYATAIHLYRHLIKTDPTNPKWTEHLQFCDPERGKVISEAGPYDGWGKDCNFLIPFSIWL
ncbi:TPA: hypothetical protein DDW35_00100, partial [Candidatus Sumerlaeota bacterium]|nr:hypothetical protein [Candidatus Sumerlaeota bacterium]